MDCDRFEGMEEQLWFHTTGTSGGPVEYGSWWCKRHMVWLWLWLGLVSIKSNNNYVVCCLFSATRKDKKRGPLLFLQTCVVFCFISFFISLLSMCLVKQYRILNQLHRNFEKLLIIAFVNVQCYRDFLQKSNRG